MKKFLHLLMAFILAAPAAAHPADPRPRFRDPDAPLIQIAMLLDTSNSMDGLIGQAKSQLWRIVNDLAGARCRGRAPRIEVALYEYGNSALAAGENYVRQVLPFTGDLDQVSERLFALTTNGGEEYCGAVIKDAARNLAWDPRANTYKTIFIAGNEPFTQGGVNFRDAVARAGDRDIVVNTIFCGDRREGIQTAWKEGADRGRGAFMTINQDDAVTVARTPYDDEIERLGRDMNETFISYGDSGRRASARQAEADEKALSAAPAAAPVERSLFKGRKQYEEASSPWDAVGSVASGATSAQALKKEDLPAEFRGLDDKSLEKTIRVKAGRRAEIQKELDRLGKLRAAHLSKEAAGSKATLDNAVIDAVRAQASGKDFTFEK